MNFWFAGSVAAIALTAFGVLWWWVSSQQGRLKREEKKIHDEAKAHVVKLEAGAKKRKKVASAEPVGSTAVTDGVIARVRRKMGLK